MKHFAVSVAVTETNIHKNRDQHKGNKEMKRSRTPITVSAMDSTSRQERLNILILRFFPQFSSSQMT